MINYDSMIAELKSIHVRLDRTRYIALGDIGTDDNLFPNADQRTYRELSEIQEKISYIVYRLERINTKDKETEQNNGESEVKLAEQSEITPT